MRELRSGGEAGFDEKKLLQGFFGYFERLKPRLVSFNGRGFDLPVLKYRAMKHGVSASHLHQAGDKWNSYTSRYALNWHCDLQDVLSDYGAFRDLQRHRMLSIDWQDLSARHGYAMPAAIDEVRAQDDWLRVMDDSAALHAKLAERCHPLVAQYAVSMAYRVRYYMRMNAREAMHVLELRTTPQGHPTYRRVCQTMHELIARKAGHTAIAEAMRFVDHSAVELERLEAERASERKRTGDATPVSDPP